MQRNANHYERRHQRQSKVCGLKGTGQPGFEHEGEKQHRQDEQSNPCPVIYVNAAFPGEQRLSSIRDQGEQGLFTGNTVA